MPANAIRSTRHSIEKAVRGVGVEWVRTLTRTYDVAKMRDTLKEALTTNTQGAQGDRGAVGMHAEQAAPHPAADTQARQPRQAGGARALRRRSDTCTGDHSCIRLSGCPSLTIAPNPDPLRREPVTKVINSCVGCGLCGEVSHAAVLCPSFYRASLITNPNWLGQLKAQLRAAR